MLLTVDVRNTNIVLGLFSGTGEYSKLLQDWRMRTDPRMTADELALTFRGLLGSHVDQITGVAALSTVPSVLREIRVMLERYWGHVPMWWSNRVFAPECHCWWTTPKRWEPTGSSTALPLTIFTRGHALSWTSVRRPVSTSFPPRVSFWAGCIAPGLEISTDALASQSAALRKVELVRPRSVVGKNTVECMQSGAVFGFAGLVDGLVNRVRDELPEFGGDDVSVIATGDSAPLIIPESDTIDHLERDLTLEGLRLVFERNQARRGSGRRPVA